jgi:NAD(P)-dependent dehydrogenase (short-subunit alcohol dehydrogenase family)
VVTGASRGIGRGIADRCAQAGASVLGVSRAGSVGSGLDGQVALSLDVTDPNAGERIVAGALDRFGRVDGLVNNAGVNISAPCWEQTDEDWDTMFAVNLTAPFVIGQALARHWRADGRPGTIVNVCSVESEWAWPSPPQAAYATTKGALLGLTRTMALDLADDGIRVVGIAPGVIETEMSSDQAAAEAMIPLGHRPGTPNEIGDAAVFLLSDRAAYVTGEMLYVDGGYQLP